MPNITVEEWLAELDRMTSEPTGEGSFTAFELSSLWSVNEKTTRRRLNKLNAIGKLVVTKKQITSIDGRKFLVPSYALKR
jgi:hypothetical protein